jgi:hypothetical protein
MHRSAAGLALTRVLVYTHRWLGIALGLLFAAWFISGVVLMYTGMPRLSPAERLSRLPELDFTTAAVAPAAAAHAAAGTVSGMRLGMLAGRPVYRFRNGSATVPVYADDGQAAGPASADLALNEARRFSPEHAATARYDGRLLTPDQWTLEIARLLPMHRIALGDPEGTQIYVTESSGEIVLKTTAASRRWAYPGAILHWIYLTPIRRHSAAWAQLIIWTSVAGTAMCVAGLAWGLWRYSPRRAYRLKRRRSHSPYAGWMWWHHYAGIAFGVFTLTWIFSGLLSMDPWDWHPSTAPTAEQRRALSGVLDGTDAITVADLQTAIARLHEPREATIVPFQGCYWLASAGKTASLGTHETLVGLDERAIEAAAAHAVPGARIVDVARLHGYDAYYYDRHGELPLPVLRIRYDDPVRTWLYVDANRGQILRKEERLTRLNRWLYHGLHSLDFPFLYYRRPLWDIVVIGLSIGGFVLTLTTVVPAWRRLLRHARRLARAPWRVQGS